MFYLSMSLEFIFGSEDEHYEVFSVFYFLGNMSSIFFILFEVIDEGFQSYRKNRSPKILLELDDRPSLSKVKSRRKSKRKKSLHLKKKKGQVVKQSQEKQSDQSMLRKVSTKLVKKSRF